VRLGPVDVSSDLAARRPDLVPGRHALLTVSDTGHGMSTETLERAFDPFYTTKPAGQGTGLGLPVIRDIVQALGGTIEIQSEPGQGTRVAVYLPAAAQREKFSTASTVNEGANAGARHILLVEDEEFLRSMLARQLEDLGYRVTAHGSSVEALEDFRGRTADFDALLTDNSMPGMTGIALAEKLVALRPGLPVLLMSGLARHADPDEMAARGIRFLLPQPYTGAELADAVRRMMAG
jgi:CheY-like chemotaxis protein